MVFHDLSLLLYEYNSLNLSSTVCGAKLLRRCRHPRVPVKSPSSTCCRPTTFFWCGSRVDAILLFRGQQHQKAVFTTKSNIEVVVVDGRHCRCRRRNATLL